MGFWSPWLWHGGRLGRRRRGESSHFIVVKVEGFAADKAAVLLTFKAPANFLHVWAGVGRPILRATVWRLLRLVPFAVAHFLPPNSNGFTSAFGAARPRSARSTAADFGPVVFEGLLPAA